MTKMPTPIIDGGGKLTGVAATLWFLGRHYPEAELLPQFGDSHRRGVRHFTWMSFIARGFEARRRRSVGRYSIAEALHPALGVAVPLGSAGKALGVDTSPNLI